MPTMVSTESSSAKVSSHLLLRYSLYCVAINKSIVAIVEHRNFDRPRYNYRFPHHQCMKKISMIVFCRSILSHIPYPKVGLQSADTLWTLAPSFVRKCRHQQVLTPSLTGVPDRVLFV